jgi:hypothetical protein
MFSLYVRAQASMEAMLDSVEAMLRSVSPK